MTTTITSEIKYNGYIIKPAPNYTRQHWMYVHEDYDGSEDKRIGGGNTIADCKAEIDEAIAEETEFRNSISVGI